MLSDTITCFTYDGFQRLSLDVRVADNAVGFTKSLRLLLDTGASTVFLSAVELNLSAEQEDYIKAHSQRRSTGGIISGVSAETYRYIVSQLCVGGKISLREFPVDISFDCRVHRSLLGMSFLKLFDVHLVVAKNLLTLQALPATEKFVTGLFPVRNIDNAPVFQNYLESLDCSVLTGTPLSRDVQKMSLV